MKKFRFFLSALALFLCSAVAFAQSTIKVTGVITEKESGLALPGAAVQEKGVLTNGAISGDNGEYTIRVAKDAVLVFVATGFESIEIPVNGRTEINVTLASDAIMLEGAISVGYGSAKKVGNIVGSVTTVKSDVVKNAPTASALDLLQGQVAGMQVLSTGGVAGDNNISMKIHGTGSLGASSEPLFIVDGVQSSSSAVMSMSPNDILNVTVLTDASSTSIYGAQGANGVVYVTTKSGAYNRDATVTLTSQYGISTLANEQFYKNMMSASELKNFWVRSGLMSDADIAVTYTNKGYDANTVWYKYMQRLNNPQYQNDLTIEGGSEKIAYMIAASQFHQDGNTIGNYYDRYTLRSNVQARPKDWLKMGINVNASIEQDMSNGNWGSSTDYEANYISGGLSYLLNPLYPAIDSETGKEYAVKYPTGIYNPWYYMEKTHIVYDTYRVLGSAFAEIDFTKDLIFTSRVGIDAYLSTGKGITYPSYEAANGIGSISRSTRLGAKATITNTLEYSHSFDNQHDFSVLLGHEYVDYTYSAYSAYGTGLKDDNFMSLDGTEKDTRSVSQTLSQYCFLSFFAHADYSYSDKYFADFTVRNDASSRFGKNKRNGTFWATGLMWKASNEDFVKDNLPWVNSLNLKASYGTQGNANIGYYSHLGTVSASAPYHKVTGIALSSPSNEDITWENQTLTTISLESRLFDFLDLNVSVYDRQTRDMLMQVPQPYTSGFTMVYANVGSMYNRGIDLELGVDLVNTRDLSLSLRAVFNYNNEKVTKLFNGYDRWEIANTGVTYVVGSPVMFYYPIYAGVDPEDGAPMWYLPAEKEEEYMDEETGAMKTRMVLDKDVCTMDPNRTTKEFDEDKLTQNTGYRLNEPINGGFGLSARYKNFSLRADFSYVLGKHLINNDKYFYANPNVFAEQNQHKMVTDFWTPYHTDAQFPDWSQGYEMQFDTHVLEDASFLRLKTLVLAYNLPQSVLKHQKFFKGATFTLTGRNLFTLTNYTGMDPEVDMNLTMGIPGNTLQVLGGIELKF